MSAHFYGAVLMRRFLRGISGGGEKAWQWSMYSLFRPGVNIVIKTSRITVALLSRVPTPFLGEPDANLFDAAHFEVPEIHRHV